MTISMAALLFCGEGGDDTGRVMDINITFLDVTQAGGISGNADSTTLTLSCNLDPTTLTADNIALTGATKGALTGAGTTRTLAISNNTVANGATVSVAITSHSGNAITGSPQTSVVYAWIILAGK
jgi:hypothetical protein